MRKKDIINHSVELGRASFVDLVMRQEEFPFFYQGKKYEIVYGAPNDKILSLYLDDGSRSGKLLQSFQSPEDFLAKGKINGKLISQIIDQIDF